MQIIDEFEKQLEKDLRDDALGGSISAAIVRKNEIIWTRTFGPTTLNGEQLATADTIYRVGSITKSFTAFVMMQLVRAGIIELDQPVEECLPAIRELAGYGDKARITFRQLASHTAGLVREPALEKADAGPIKAWEQKVLDAISKTAVEFPPGERFSYSNIGYGILGVALGRAAQTPFIELVAERILKPLQMDNSFFMVPEHRRDDLAQGIGGGPFGDGEPDLEGPHQEHAGRGYKVPNGGLYSTPTDLAKFIMANLGHSDLLGGHHLESLHSNQTPETRFRHYGLGFELYKDQTFAIAGHTGGLPGYSADLEFEKVHGYGVIFMRNYNWGTTSWDIGPKILLRKLAEADKKP